MTSHPPPAVAVVDTNVLLDIFSCHDLTDTFDAIHALNEHAAVDNPSVVHRRARARESLLLALYFNAIGATTYSLRNEADSMLTTKVPPGQESLEMHYTTLAVWFVKSLLLLDWNAGALTPASGWEKNLSKPPVLRRKQVVAPTGNNADAWHIACAKEHGLPLVTNEGFNPTSYKEGKIARRAKADGVRALFPKDFYAGKIDEAAEIGGFLQRFRDEAPAYLETNPSQRNALQMMFGVYRHTLLGETEGHTEPVRVTISLTPNPAPSQRP
jgi:hypothetical protein